MGSRLVTHRAQALWACPSLLASRPISGATTTATTARWFARTVVPNASRSRFYSAAAEDLRKTPLYDFHIAHGAKMVPFAGHHMPALYSSLGLADSHHFTRKNASLFDVSHMVQHRFAGPGAARFLETACPSGIVSLAPMWGRLTTFLWPETGGIVDDAIVTRLDDDTFYVVTNGACRDKDIKFFDDQMATFKQANAGAEDAVERTSYQGGLLALQGPMSAEILAEMLADPEAVDLTAFKFGSSRWAKLKLDDGTTTGPLLISRGGYTGEDGFEISAAPSVTLTVEMTRLAETLLAVAGPERLQLAGLGARDSLRLEAGMCLYGQELDDKTTPAEAGLSWVISRDRRKPKGAPFNGKEVVLAQMFSMSRDYDATRRRRVGLILEEGAGPAARAGAIIKSVDTGDDVGIVTSGMPSPTLGRNIAMGYVQQGLHGFGTEVDIVVRGKPRRAVVHRLPFVQTKYWKGPSRKKTTEAAEAAEAAEATETPETTGTKET